jgi:hypothetical protein
MPTASSQLIIGLGAPTVAVSSLTILSVGQDGDPSARGLLTHPDSFNFAPIAYYKNPDFTSNLDNAVLTAPDVRMVKTSSSSKLIRNEGLLVDVVCEETWGAQEGSRASMPTFLFRQLYEYLRNPPVFDATQQTFITWAPRYRSLLSYNVHVFQMKVGAGSGAAVFNVREYRGQVGPIASPFEGMDVSPTGLMDQPVTLSLHVVSEAA